MTYRLPCRLLAGLLAFCAWLPQESVSAQAGAYPLEGRWELRLWVTGSAGQSAGPRRASGAIELQRLDLPAPSKAEVYSVSYDSTLHAMLGHPRFGPAQAVQTAPSRVELAFNPFVDHGAFRLAGTAQGDSIAGQWHRTNFADDGYRGEFIMVRRR
jgi:hypothetical protein